MGSRDALGAPTAPEVAQDAIAAVHGPSVAESVIAIIDRCGLAIRRRQQGTKRWARTAQRLHSDEYFRERHAAIKRRTPDRAQNATAPTAGRRGLSWTGPELEIAARTDLSGEEVAQMTGRTYHAVTTMRAKLKRDPAKYDLAGIRERDGGDA